MGLTPALPNESGLGSGIQSFTGFLFLQGVADKYAGTIEEKRQARRLYNEVQDHDLGASNDVHSVGHTTPMRSLHPAGQPPTDGTINMHLVRKWFDASTSSQQHWSITHPLPPIHACNEHDHPAALDMDMHCRSPLQRAFHSLDLDQMKPEFVCFVTQTIGVLLQKFHQIQLI